MRDKKMTELAKEIELFIQYGVREDKQPDALKLLDSYRLDPVGLRILQEFYRSLPEAREEPVLRIVLIESHQGILLLGVLAGSFEYRYLVNETEVVYLGEKNEDLDEEILEFFGYKDNQELAKSCRHFSELEEFRSHSRSGKMCCPVCSVLEGELHQFGCPVEVCPWCGGQLNRCNCRFDQLGVEQIADDEEIGKLEKLLLAKGRIRFAGEHAPAYPTAGNSQGGG